MKWELNFKIDFRFLCEPARFQYKTCRNGTTFYEQDEATRLQYQLRDFSTRRVENVPYSTAKSVESYPNWTSKMWIRKIHFFSRWAHNLSKRNKTLPLWILNFSSHFSVTFLSNNCSTMAGGADTPIDLTQCRKVHKEWVCPCDPTVVSCVWPLFLVNGLCFSCRLLVSY